jgi:hypothetical protein
MRVVVVVLMALALGVVNSANASTSGLRGLVTRGPTTPVCVAGLPCSKPAKNLVITFTRGSARRSVKTDSKGRYLIALAPGAWKISIAGTRFGYRPRSALVPKGAVGVRNITIDTGIR